MLPGHYDHREAIRGVAEASGVGNILGIAKTAGEWQITVNEKVNIERIVENGIAIAGADVPVRNLSRNVVVVSLFDVPYYITNEMLSSKLRDFGVKQMSAWTRKCFYEFPTIQNGIVFCRVEISDGITSLPYATRIADVNQRIKHNGQSKVCNLCLSEDHLMQSCPQGKTCYNCGMVGHVARSCPDAATEAEMTLG